MRKSAFTLVELLVVIGILAVIVALIVPAVQKVRESASCLQCANNLKQIGLATHAYHDATRLLPAGTHRQSGASALVPVLPYLEQRGVESLWDLGVGVLDVRNAPAATAEVPIYLCPSDPAVGGLTRKNVSNNQDGRTNYAASLGANGWMGNRNAGTGGPFFKDAGLRLSDIRDGVNGTAMFAEIKRSTFSGKTPGADVRKVQTWISPSPRDATPPTECDAPLKYGLRLSGVQYFRGKLIMTGYYTHTIPPNNPSPDCCNKNADAGHHAARSYHPGGVNVAFCDGSIRWIASGISINTWRALGTRSGGEAVAVP